MAARFSYSLFFFLLFFVNSTWAEVAIPQLSKRVTDLTGTLTAEQNTVLENKLASFEAKKGSQIVVLILPTTQPETIEAFGIRLFDAWKIGRKNINDGVILIVAKDDRKLRLEIGRGLEGAIPDAIAKRVIAEIITPKFKENDFYGGIDAGVNQIIKLIEGESLPAPTNITNTSENDNFYQVLGVFLCFIAIDFVIYSLVDNNMLTNMLFTGMIAGVATGIALFFIDNSFLAIPIGLLLGFWLGSMISGFLKVVYEAISGKIVSSTGSSSSSNSWSSSGSSSSSSGFSGGGGDSGGGGASGSW